VSDTAPATPDTASTLQLTSRVRDYTATFQPDASFLGELVAMPNRFFVVDENVWAAHGEGVLSVIPREDLMLLPIAEETKTLASVERVWDALMERSAKRNMTIVSVGGGICQDITGFAASTLYRGIGWVFLPTTLLAQADSCIGSKTSLNYRRFKNLLGTFFPPNAVHIFAPFLTTQAEIDYYSGLGEVVKLHVMGGAESAARLEADIMRVRERDVDALSVAVRESLRIKTSYIEGDEFDLGRRNLLNYGHCFGHAIETATDYAVPHGQGVVIGMMMAQRVARERGLETDAEQIALLDRLFAHSLLQEFVPAHIDLEAVVEAMKHDKKRTGEGLVVVMAADGLDMIKRDDVSVDEAMRAAQAVLGELAEVAR
jgi:3-dehydroquinate synthase